MVDLIKEVSNDENNKPILFPNVKPGFMREALSKNAP